MKSPDDVVFLFDCDNTLLDNDGVQSDLRTPLERESGRASRDRLTTAFPRQGHYALDSKNIAAYPPAAVKIEHIGDLFSYDLPAFPSHGDARRTR